MEGLAKSYGELEKRMSTMRPHQVPETPEAYNFKPETLPEGATWDEAAAGKFAAAFHKGGVSEEAAKEIAALFVEHELEAQAAMSAAYEKQIQEGTEKLKKEWGAQYQEKVSKIKSIAASLGYEHTDPVFANPAVVSLLGKVVGMLGEDTVASMRGAVAPGGKFVSGVEEANAIMRDAKHPDHDAYIRGDATIIAKVKRLIDNP